MKINKLPQSAYVITAVAAICIIVAAIGKENDERPKANISKRKKIDFPLRVIYVSATSQDLIAYTLHNKDSDGMPYRSFCAVIKNIDPSKEDFKNYCRAIIADIIKSVGTDEIAIYIYDDTEAYRLSEVDYPGVYKDVNKEEADLIKQHTIAIYSGDIGGYDEDNHTISYYSLAGSRFTGKEIYNPAQNPQVAVNRFAHFRAGNDAAFINIRSIK